MTSRRDLRALLAVVLAGLVACPPARGLVTFNDSHDHIYVTGSFGVSHDSNVFASNNGQGDFVYNSGITAEYTRRAGWIGVSGTVSVNAGKFGRLTSQDFANPGFGLVFTKQSGRTKGAINLSAARESRADAAVNMRTTTWNYGADLSFRYPINGLYDLSGSFGWNQRKYIDSTIFANLSTYTANADLVHVFSSERDILAGYRYRYSETSYNTSSVDHSFSTGLTGRLLRGVNGSIRAGYQTRIPGGAGSDHKNFSSWTASASSTYAFSKKLNFAGSLAKDFSTTATDASVDALSASIDATYAYSSHWSGAVETSWSDSRFLGEAGRVVAGNGPLAILGPQRHDTSLSTTAGLSYTLNEHLKLSLNYVWFINWSTSAFADFVRNSWNLNASSRW